MTTKNVKRGCVAVLAFLGVLFRFSLASAAEYVPGQVLVLLRSETGTVSAKQLATAEGADFVTRVAKSAGAGVAKTWGALSEARGEVFTLMTSDSKTTEELMALLKADPRVISVSPNFKIRAALEPDDPRYVSGELWGMKSIRADEAWSVTTGSDSVYVAVMDSGIYAAHEDLAANVDMERARNFAGSTAVSDQNGHGTHVSGTIGAVGNNGTGVTGVAWQVKIIPLQVLGADGTGDSGMAVDALDYVVDLLKNNPGMKIAAINLSLGGWASDSPQELYGTPYWAAFRTLDAMNRTVIVVAAGNEGHEVGKPAPRDVSEEIKRGDYVYPASFTGLDNMIVVGAIDENNAAASFSNWSETLVHLAAPGVNILSTYPPQLDYDGDRRPDGLSYVSMPGTSMATPHVSGAVALLAAANPDFTASRLKSSILRGANGDVNPTLSGGQTLSAYGLLDIPGALEAAEVFIPATDIAIAPGGIASDGNVTLPAGDTTTLSAVVTPLEASERVARWSSDNEKVATVDGAGQVTAVAVGRARITAQTWQGATEGDALSKSVEVVVTRGGLTPIPVDPARDSGGGGGCNGGLLAPVLALVLFLFAATRKPSSFKNK